ncbi:LPKTxAVK-anchored surface protein [Streptococcus pluranimalium]
MNNKVTLSDGIVVERPAVATSTEAATKEASKALPKTSAVK